MKNKTLIIMLSIVMATLIFVGCSKQEKEDLTTTTILSTNKAQDDLTKVSEELSSKAENASEELSSKVEDASEELSSKSDDAKNDIKDGITNASENAKRMNDEIKDRMKKDK